MVPSVVGPPLSSLLLRLFQLLSITQLHFFGTKDVSLFLNLSNLPYKQFEVLPTKIFWKGALVLKFTFRLNI